MTYQTLNHPAQAQIVIKKSEFIGFAYPVTEREQAMFHVEQLRLQYPDARHHCWAYIIGDPNNTTSAGFDDDGEPNGTAGRPILNVLQHKAIGNVILIVVRYFGGIKLGAGGLTRAYAQTAQAVVDAMTLVTYVPRCQIRIQTNFANEAKVRYLLDTVNGEVMDVTYTHQVLIIANVAEQDLAQLEQELVMVGELVTP